MGLHIYNLQTSIGNPGNYERGVLDWNVTSNVFSIGTQAGGTGIVRPVQLLGIPTKTTPVSADQILLQDSASSNTLKWANWSSLPSGGGGMSIGGAVTGGTAGSVLYINPAATLAQDNTNFVWDDANKYLKIGSMGTQAIVYLNTLPALYQIQNASGSNWFEGNAGNVSLTGYLNFGTGDSCLANVTTGYQNVGVGSQAMQHLTSGYVNIALGSQALQSTLSDSNNVAIGYGALALVGTGGIGSGNNFSNIGIGQAALGNMHIGRSNIVLGTTAALNIGGYNANTEGVNNIIIGVQAGNNLGVSAGAGTVDNNTLVGPSAGVNLSGISIRNTWIGGYQGRSAVTYNSICLSDGQPVGLLDFNYTSFGIWSFNMNVAYGMATGVHIYNYQDAFASVANYERAMLDWNPTANVFRIASQAAGSGTVRLIAIDGFQKSGAPAAGDLPSGSFALINDTSGGATWLCYNAAGTIRKVQLT
jgi:hypothetical protein